MDVKIIIDESVASPEVVIKAREITPEIQHVIELLRGNHDRQLLGYNDREVFILDASKIFSIHTEGNKVTAVTEDGSFYLKNRLYEIDENTLSIILLLGSFILLDYWIVYAVQYIFLKRQVASLNSKLYQMNTNNSAFMREREFHL